MKHAKTVLASSIIAAFVGASSLSFAQSAMLTDPLARDANANPHAWVGSEVPAPAELAYLPAAQNDGASHANVTLQRGADAETGPLNASPLPYEISSVAVAAAEQGANPLVRGAEVETGAWEVAAFQPETYSVAVANNEPSAEPPADTAVSSVALNERILEQYATEQQIAVASEQQTTSPLTMDYGYLREYASAPSSTDAASGQEQSPAPSDTYRADGYIYNLPVNTETAAPISTSVPVTDEDEVTTRSLPPVTSTPVDDKE